MPNKKTLFQQGTAAASVTFGLCDAYVCPLCQLQLDVAALGRGQLTAERMQARWSLRGPFSSGIHGHTPLMWGHRNGARPLSLLNSDARKHAVAGRAILKEAITA